MLVAPMAINPVWSKDGRRLYFSQNVDGRTMIMSVSVTVRNGTLALSPATPALELSGRGADGAWTYRPGSNLGPGFEVRPDGRFVVVRTPEVPTTELVVVEHWFDDLRRLTAAR
jgi:hypothetical protein